jgi:hypothetical protein
MRPCPNHGDNTDHPLVHIEGVDALLGEEGEKEGDSESQAEKSRRFHAGARHKSGGQAARRPAQ